MQKFFAPLYTKFFMFVCEKGLSFGFEKLRPFLSRLLFTVWTQTLPWCFNHSAFSCFDIERCIDCANLMSFLSCYFVVARGSPLRGRFSTLLVARHFFQMSKTVLRPHYNSNDTFLWNNPSFKQLTIFNFKSFESSFTGAIIPHTTNLNSTFWCD